MLTFIVSLMLDLVKSVSRGLNIVALIGLALVLCNVRLSVKVPALVRSRRPSAG